MIALLQSSCLTVATLGKTELQVLEVGRNYVSYGSQSKSGAQNRLRALACGRNTTPF